MNDVKINLKKRLALETFRRLHRNRVKLHELRTLFWECTLRCNVACRHCGSDCRVSSLMPDMPMADFLRVVDEIRPHVNPHKVLIIFTGGEALVRPDIEACGRELYRREFPWGIVSNGLLFAERLPGLLAAGMRSATISLDGFEDDHNWMRGHRNSFRAATASIRGLAQTTDVNWDVVTCANRRNFDDLPRFKRYLIDLGVRHWRIFTVFPVGRAAHVPELQLTDEQFVRLMRFLRETRREGQIDVSYGCEGFLGGYEMDVRDHFYECSAGVSIHLGLPQHPGRLLPGQHLSRPLHGRLGEPFPALPRSPVGASGRVRRVPTLSLLRGQRHAPPRLRWAVARVPSSAYRAGVSGGKMNSHWEPVG